MSLPPPDAPQSLFDTVTFAFLQNYHLDHSNATIHCAKVRYSPLTFRLAEHLYGLAEPFDRTLCDEAVAVLRDKGAYPEDTGR